jgi:predicted DNA-binding transcriptional regulator AlpA
VGRKLDVDELVGTAEIVKRMGLGEQRTVHSWTRRDPTFPAPVVKLERAMIWYWPEVEEWARKTGRLE